MYKLSINLDNVSLRAFLYLLDQKNARRELSNTTICDYILSSPYSDMFMSRYKDPQSFRSGYAGNLSLIFDSDESQTGSKNKFTKTLDKNLKKAIADLKTSKINISDTACIIENIPDEQTYRILSVFFCLKPINAFINRKIDLSNAEGTWLPLLANKMNKSVSDFPADASQITGRGDEGRKSTLNRYTIYHYGNNWFDIIKPSYFNFCNLRYKVFLHNLLIEQDNLYFCIITCKRYDFDYNEVFEQGITFTDDSPAINSSWLDLQFNFNDMLIIRKSDLQKLLLDTVELPQSYQYMFTVSDKSILCSDGSIIDLTPYLVNDYTLLQQSANMNPNITFNEQLETELQQRVRNNLSSLINPIKQIRKYAINGEESNTIMKFIDKSIHGDFIINDYIRDKADKIILADKKTCLILYNGTKYPDLVCIFLEDAEKVERKGKRSISEYTDYVWHNSRKFEHLFFQVEAEFNMKSFKDHDTSKEKVLQSKYIFCENKTADTYISSFEVEIPVISIKDL